MVDRIKSNKFEYQETIVLDVESRFGSEWVYYNDSGNPAISRKVLAEFRKVTWPSRAELINSTAVVIVVTVVLAFFLGGVDIVLARVVERILR